MMDLENFIVCLVQYLYGSKNNGRFKYLLS